MVLINHPEVWKPLTAWRAQKPPHDSPLYINIIQVDPGLNAIRLITFPNDLS